MYIAIAIITSTTPPAAAPTIALIDCAPVALLETASHSGLRDDQLPVWSQVAFATPRNAYPALQEYTITADFSNATVKLLMIPYKGADIPGQKGVGGVGTRVGGVGEGVGAVGAGVGAREGAIRAGTGKALGPE